MSTSPSRTASVGSRDTLKALLGSTSRAKVLAHFLLHPGEAFHVRALGRLLDESAGNLLRDLRKLRAIGLLVADRAGNQIRYSVNVQHPLYEDLQRIILKTVAVDRVLKEFLASGGGVELAFLYGSFAKGTADTRSDIDVMVIGSASDRSIASRIARAEGILKRPVSYTLFTRGDARREALRRGSFLNSVLKGPLIMIVGERDDDVLRLAQRQKDRS